METPWVVVLILVAAWLLTGLVLGILYWRRGQQLDDANRRSCILQQEVDRLGRADRLGAEHERLEGLTNDQLLAELMRVRGAGDERPE